MSDEMKPHTERYPHSHDSMYLVSHLGDTDYPAYDSCHHCSFISVPELSKSQSRVKELEEDRERWADSACRLEKRYLGVKEENEKLKSELGEAVIHIKALSGTIYDSSFAGEAIQWLSRHEKGEK